MLSRTGFCVDVLTFPFGEDVDIPGVRILRLPRLPGIDDIPIGPSWRKLLMDILLLFYAGWRLARARYAVVHACEESALAAAALQPLFGFLLIYDMDDVLSLRTRSSGFMRRGPLLRLLKALERWTLWRADLVLTNSPDTTRYAQRYARRARVIFYDHVPPLPAPETLREPDRLRREHGLEGRKLILYAGNLEPYQGVDLLLRSLPRVFARLPEACCVVIGGEAPQIERLRREAARLKVASSVQLWGKRPIDDSFPFMQAADVLVLPGVAEEKAVPMKLYAYLASDSPIVATNLANHADLLKGRAAVLVSPDPKALADAITQVLQEPRPAVHRCPLPWDREEDARVLQDAYRSLL